MPREVFITGGTGQIGRRLARALLAGGHRVRVLARAASVARVPEGASPVVGNALDAASSSAALAPADTIVHLGRDPTSVAGEGG